MQQNIVYHTYSVKNGTWSDASVAINGANDGSFPNSIRIRRATVEQ